MRRAARLALAALAWLAVCGVVRAMPRRLVSGPGGSARHEEVRMGNGDRGHLSHARQAVRDEERRIDGEEGRAADFSGLDALEAGADYAAPGSDAALGGLPRFLEVDSRRRSGREVGGMPVEQIASISDRAVDDVLRQMGVDRPVEDEHPMPRPEMPSQRAAAAQIEEDAKAAPPPPAAAARGKHHASRAPRRFDPSSLQPGAGSLLELGAEYGRHGPVRRLPHRPGHEEQQQQQQQHKPEQQASALNEMDSSSQPRRFTADFAPPDDGSDHVERSHQPTSKELFDFFSKQMPKRVYGPKVEIERERPAAPRFAEARAGARARMAAGAKGYHYKPSPFKHPPPPPVPPPPPPPPPPNFGEGSSFSGYRFVQTGKNAAANNEAVFLQMYEKAARRPGAPRPQQRQRQQSAQPAPPPPHARRPEGAAGPASPEFEAYWSAVSGEQRRA